MKIQQLDTLEKAQFDATHKAVISFADGDFTAAATSQVYTLAPLVARDKISNAFTRVPTFLSGGAVSAAVAIVGDTGTTNGYVTSSSVFTGGVNGRAGDGSLLNQAGGKVYTAADSLILTITTTTANVNALTAGEIHVFFTLCNIGNV